MKVWDLEVHAYYRGNVNLWKISTFGRISTDHPLVVECPLRTMSRPVYELISIEMQPSREESQKGTFWGFHCLWEKQ